MSSLFPDTYPEAETVLIRLLREAPSWRKLEMVDLLNQSVKLLALVGLRQRFPLDNDDRQYHQKPLRNSLRGAVYYYGMLEQDRIAVQ